MTWFDLLPLVQTEPEWWYWFEDQRIEATNVACRIPLLHVTSRADLSRIQFAELFAGNPAVIPTSADPHYCSESTRRAEDILALGRCVYFYAGRALPEFGLVALGFLPDVEQGHTGSATPFDTGGWVADPPHCVRSILRAGPKEEMYAFAKRSTVPLQEWRGRFAEYLAAYFRPLQSYWDGWPWHLDPGELFDEGENDCRAWLVEVRFLEPQPVDNVSAWCAAPQYMEWLRRWTLAGPAAAYKSPLKQFLREKPPLASRGHVQYCQILEEWSKEVSGV